MSNDAILAALDGIRGRINARERELDDLEKRLAADKEEEQLLARLLAVRRGEALPRQTIPAIDPSVARLTAAGRTDSPVQAVIEELGSAGRPIHISDLMRLLALRKIAIPGAGTQANLITYLRRDRRFVRASRGMYALAEWGLEAMAPTRRRKRRKRGRARTN
jgi:hypothetical protein